jgi:hypothetical protein
MEKNSTRAEAAPLFAGEAWFDPIEAELRERVRRFLEEMVEQEATAALGRGRYQRGAAIGYRKGSRARRLLGSFGPVDKRCPERGCCPPTGAAGNGTARSCRAMRG